MQKEHSSSLSDMEATLWWDANIVLNATYSWKAVVRIVNNGGYAGIKVRHWLTVLLAREMYQNPRQWSATNQQLNRDKLVLWSKDLFGLVDTESEVLKNVACAATRI